MFPHKLPYAIIKRKPIRTNVTMVITCFLRVLCHCKYLWLSESRRIFLCKWRHVPCVMMSSIFCSLSILNIRKHGLLTALITEPVCAITTMGSEKIWVLPKRVKPMTFWLLVLMLYHWATGYSRDLRPLDYNDGQKCCWDTSMKWPLWHSFVLLSFLKFV